MTTLNCDETHTWQYVAADTYDAFVGLQAGVILVLAASGVRHNDRPDSFNVR